MRKENLNLSFEPPSAHSSILLSAQARIVELEMENTRLQQLVAELLLKNQQLRKQEA
jgi:hypothetical protein